MPDKLTPATVLASARAWIDTPYHDGASIKGVGCDCLGLARGVWRELMGEEVVPLPAYSRGWKEMGPEEALLDGLSGLMTRHPPAPLREGALAVFRMADGVIAKHCGFLANVSDKTSARLIHAYDRGQRSRVREEPLTNFWRSRLVAQFVLPGVSD